MFTCLYRNSLICSLTTGRAKTFHILTLSILSSSVTDLASVAASSFWFTVKISNLYFHHFRRPKASKKFSKKKKIWIYPPQNQPDISPLISSASRCIFTLIKNILVLRCGYLKSKAYKHENSIWQFYGCYKISGGLHANLINRTSQNSFKMKYIITKIDKISKSSYLYKLVNFNMWTK